MYRRAIALNDNVNIYKDSDYLDCRISAYVTSLEPLLYTIDLIMIDLDQSDFNDNIKSLDQAKKKTLTKIKIYSILCYESIV